MINIDNGSYSLDEVESYIKSNSDNFLTNKKLEVVNVHSTNFNNGVGRDYEHCMPIKHPETGEELRPIRGYVGLDELRQDRCYYAEYQDKKGRVYSYTYKFPYFDRYAGKTIPSKTISQQLKEDLKSLEEKLANENAGMEM